MKSHTKKMLFEFQRTLKVKWENLVGDAFLSTFPQHILLVRSVSNQNVHGHVLQCNLWTNRRLDWIS